MTNNELTTITIFGMALVTYLTRTLGFFLANKISKLPPAIEQALKYIPGTIIVSIIAPQIIEGGSISLITSLICIGAALVFRNLVAVMITGVMTISILRNFIFI